MNIIQKIVAYIKSFFTKQEVQKVEDILAEVTATVKKLEQAAVAHTEAAAKHAAAVVVAEAKKLEAEAQTALANGVANNIRALLTPKA